jgi:DEAD/DEAH box helicase domain-containing protein
VRAETLPAPAGNRDEALHDALTQVTGGRLPAIRSAPQEPPGTGIVEAPATAVVTAVHRLPAMPAAHVPFPDGLDSRLLDALVARGIHQLYSHQAEALSHAAGGRHVVVVTPTASGKTLCYNLPILDSILRDSSARALYLFPTKALAQDQLAELQGLTEAIARADGPPVGVFTYDGDTPQDARRAIRGRAHLVLSNPDMLHSGILPHHPRWAKLFENLRFVVIDELHAYRGVFGSHLANILRRLHRICCFYGSQPVFICSSATIANPRELAERLVERPFELVDRSGAPRGEKFFVFVNPPVVNAALGIRRSYLAQARQAGIEFLRRGLQVILFTRSRLATEILTTYLKGAFPGGPGAPESIRGYRGGYLPLRRREIERGLREGVVRGVVSTNALELGIDIGALDVSVMAGYPGTIAATWQRAGRAGRRAGRSAAILIASSAPLDQFIIRNPSYFFESSPEHALINPDNLHILLDHIKCAAFELPFSIDERFGQEDVQQILEILSEEGFLHRSGEAWHWTQDAYPADTVSLRSVSSDNFVVVDTTRGSKVIGEVDFTSAPATLHEKAIYLVEGQLFHVERLDFDGRKAYVREVDCDYYTDAITYAKVTVLDVFASEEGFGVSEGESEEPGSGAIAAPGPRSLRHHGEVHVVSRVVGFKKIKFYTNENLGSGELELPEQQMHTTAYWLRIPRELMALLPYGSEDRRDGVVGLAFAMKNVAALLLMCDRHDIGLSIDGGSLEGTTRVGSAPALPESVAAEPEIFVYDNYPGGIGFSEPLYRLHDILLDRTRDLIAGCPCESGCPSCVGPDGHAGARAKAVASHLLDLVRTGWTAEA